VEGFLLERGGGFQGLGGNALGGLGGGSGAVLKLPIQALEQKHEPAKPNPK
jgi:hypothetical protein